MKYGSCLHHHVNFFMPLSESQHLHVTFTSLQIAHKISNFFALYCFAFVKNLICTLLCYASPVIPCWFDNNNSSCQLPILFFIYTSYLFPSFLILKSILSNSHIAPNLYTRYLLSLVLKKTIPPSLSSLEGMVFLFNHFLSPILFI